MNLIRTLAAALCVASLGLCFAPARAEDKTDCALSYTRTACAGQEAESYKKCDGQKSCTKYVPADSPEKCQQAAVQACSNDRLTVTQNKSISAAYKGKALKSKAGKDDLCLDYAKRDSEFNQCTKK
jgi:hypothetical protein